MQRSLAPVARSTDRLTKILKLFPIVSVLRAKQLSGRGGSAQILLTITLQRFVHESRVFGLLLDGGVVVDLTGSQRRLT